MEYKTLFDSFNARNLSFEQVAETFVENEHFEKLLKNSHSLIMGPRGCGKTTLLKMLTPKALSLYSQKTDNDIYHSMPFFALYVPTDIQWKEQIESFGREYENFPKLVKYIPKALININVYNSLLEAFVSIVEIASKEESTNITELESSLCKELIRIFELENCISASFYSIELSILNRISKINALVNQAGTVYLNDTDIPFPNYCFEDFIDKSREACFAFEKTFEKNLKPFKSPYKWAFCFDELEIAPKWLQIDLFKYLRSRDQKFIFKLTSTPTIDIEEIDASTSATAIDDYTPIRIWVSNKNDFSNWKQFCEKLISARLRRKFNKDINLNQLFDEFSYEKTLVSERKYQISLLKYKDYNPSSIYLSEFKELSNKDTSFQSYIKTKKISTLNPIPKSPKDRDEVFRKIKPYVYYRNYFINSFNEKNVRFRTRNIPNPFYFGWSDICNVSDGNPRTIMGLIDSMINHIEFDENENVKTIPPKKQAQIIYQTSKKYMDVWSTNPKSNQLISNQIYSLRNLITTIGEYFQNEILKQSFAPNPTGTFSVDNKVNHKLLRLIEVGLFLGAIVYLNPSENERLSANIIDKRFRLSFLLYPYFKLPNRMEDTQITLSNILSRDKSQNNINLELFH